MFNIFFHIIFLIVIITLIIVKNIFLNNIQVSIRDKFANIIYRETPSIFGLDTKFKNKVKEGFDEEFEPLKNKTKIFLNIIIILISLHIYFVVFLKTHAFHDYEKLGFLETIIYPYKFLIGLIFK